MSTLDKASVPAPTAVQAATAEEQNNNDNHENGGHVHVKLTPIAERFAHRMMAYLDAMLLIASCSFLLVMITDEQVAAVALMLKAVHRSDEVCLIGQNHTPALNVFGHSASNRRVTTSLRMAP
jgi:hypothetical protein